MTHCTNKLDLQIDNLKEFQKDKNQSIPTHLCLVYFVQTVSGKSYDDWKINIWANETRIDNFIFIEFQKSMRIERINLNFYTHSIVYSILYVTKKEFAFKFSNPNQENGKTKHILLNRLSQVNCLEACEIYPRIYHQIWMLPQIIWEVPNPSISFARLKAQ